MILNEDPSKKYQSSKFEITFYKMMTELHHSFKEAH